MVRCVCTSRAEIHEPGFFRSHHLRITDEFNRLVGKVFGEMVPLLRGVWLIDGMVVIHQIGIPLVGLCPDKPIETFKTPSERPAPFPCRDIAFFTGSKVPLSNGVGIPPQLDSGPRR